MIIVQSADQLSFVELMALDTAAMVVQIFEATAGLEVLRLHLFGSAIGQCRTVKQWIMAILEPRETLVK